MRVPITTAVALFCLIPVGPLRAQEDDPLHANDFSADVSVGTLGVGPEFGARLTDYLGVRMAGAYLQLHPAATINSIHYSSDATLASFGALADVYPFDGGLRLTLGVIADFNSLKLHDALPQYQVALDGKVAFDNPSPYLGFGYETTVSDQSGLTLGADLGVLFQGRPNVRVAATGPGMANPALAAAIETQRLAIASYLRPLQFYPAVMVHIGYRF